MFRYWTMWNFHWYLGSEFGLFNLNGPLRTSIINTSLIGGFMTYVYPRRIVMRKKIKDKNNKDKEEVHNLPYYQVVLLDIIFHQLPVYRLLYKDYKPGTCGFYTLAPVICWFFTNSFNEIDLDKIYGIKMIKLCMGSALITGLFGLIQHNRLKK